MGLLEGIKARITKPKTKVVPANQILTWGESISELSTGTSRMTDFQAYLDAITIPNVYAAVSVIAYAIAALPMDVVDENDNIVDLEKHAPDLKRLLDQPNQSSDGFHFRETQVYDVCLTGNNIVAMDNFDGFDRPTELYRLRPDRVRIKFDPATENLNYAYIATATSRTAMADATYNAKEILHWKTANPRDALWGMGTIEAGEVTFSADRLLNEMIRAYFERGAILDGVITLPQEELTEVEYNRLITRWRGQKQRGRAVVRTGVLTGGADYKAIQQPLGSIPIVQLKRMSRNDVLELFGVPPAKLGDFVGTNWRNAQEADSFFYGETVAPFARRIEPKWTVLVRLWNPNWRVRFRLPKLLADFAARAVAAKDMSLANSFMRNEIRVMGGNTPLEEDDPRGTEIVSTAKNNQEEATVPQSKETDETTQNLQGPPDSEPDNSPFDDHSKNTRDRLR